MEQWQARMRIEAGQVRLLVTSEERGDVLKAVLPPVPQHPRALLTLLEGLALYRGQRLSTVVSAEPDYLSWHGSALFGDELWPGESQLVRFHIVAPERRRRINGLGDFRTLRGGPRGAR